MPWVEIKGYAYRYRINEDGEVQRYWEGTNEWRTKIPYKAGGHYRSGRRLMVKLTVTPGEYAEVPVVDLMADAFMGGREAHPNQIIGHKNGYGADCSLYNLVWMTRKQAGKQYGGAGRKPVMKIDKNGEVVKIYTSMSECARKEFMHRCTVYKMIKNKVPASKSCTGYAYAFER